MNQPLPGLDLRALETYLDTQHPGLRQGDFSGALITGGRSNLTYDVTDGTSRWVLRRPPLGHVLETAHDMGREFTVISALRDSGVPVPQAVLLCTDPGPLGAPFYLMEHVQGEALRRADDLRSRGPGRTRAICEAMVRTLAALHVVDPLAVGLGDFGRPDGFTGRQVRRWKKQLDRSRSRDLPQAEQLHELLLARVPTERAQGIVHGDYRLDNLLVTERDEVAAVLDWEMSTIGDPLTDLALLSVYQVISGWPGAELITDAPRAPGYLTAGEIESSYAEWTGREPVDLAFHRALASFKLAAILEGIYYRHVQGHAVDETAGDVAVLVEPLLELGCAQFH